MDWFIAVMGLGLGVLAGGLLTKREWFYGGVAVVLAIVNIIHAGGI